MPFPLASWLLAIYPLVVAAQSGCGAHPPLQPGTSHSHTIQSQGISRSYIVFLPSNYDVNTPTPLIVNYHGHSDTDGYQETLTQLDDPFFNPDHIVVYPQGVDGTDNLSAWSGAPYSDPNVDDLQFTSDLLDHFEQTYCIDTSRIFATGKSNGGGFVNYLACHPLSSRFTAFAPVAGAYYDGYGADGDNCQPSRSPQPILEIHGYNDTTIWYYGGSRNGGTLPYVLDWIQAWGARNGCPNSDGDKTSQDNGLVDHYDFGCHTHHYAVQNADHVWESTVGNADTDRYSYGPSAINASSIVMNFFRKVPPL